MLQRWKSKKIDLSIEDAEAMLLAQDEDAIYDIALVQRLKNLNGKYKGLIEMKYYFDARLVPFWRVDITSRGIKELNLVTKKYPFYFAEKGLV